jgi:RNA polymerase sigma factor FliA
MNPQHLYQVIQHEHTRLVRTIAKGVHRQVPAFVDLESLIAAGNFGLLSASTRFDPAKGVPFKLYARKRIKGAMLDYLRTLDPLSREYRRFANQIETTFNRLRTVKGRNPTDVEMAHALRWHVHEYRSRLADIYQAGGVVSLDMPNNRADETASFLDLLISPEPGPEELLGYSELRVHLTEALATLPERWQYIFNAYYFLNLTMKEIGGLLGCNESRVSQIHKQALIRLRAALRNRGVTSATPLLVKGATA